MKKNLILNKTVNNASWIIVCKILQSVLNLFIGMITARYLGPSNYGLISYAASITAFFVPLMRLGLTSTLVQEFVSEPDNEGKILGTTLLMTVVSSFISIIGISTFCMIAHRGETDTIIVCILYSFTLVFQALELSQYWFQSKLLSKFPSIAALAAYILVSLYKVYVLIADKSVYWFAVTHVIESAMVSTLLLIFYYKMSKHKLTVSYSLGRRMLSKSKYYIISGMSVIILQSTDKFMLKNIVDDKITGYYSAAVTCAGIFSFVYTAIIDSMRPQILKQKKVSTAKFEEYLSLLYTIIFYISLIQCIVTTLFAKPIVNLLYGEAYLASADVLRVAVWVITFSFFGNVISIWILGEQKDGMIIGLGLFGAGTNILLNLLFIPWFGAVGAATASLLTQFLKNFVFCYFFKPLRRNVVLMLRGIDPRFLIKQIRKIL